MTQTAIPCTIMRGGTSKGLYFRREDLPADIATRDAVLLSAVGSPDLRQIDGTGGAVAMDVALEGGLVKVRRSALIRTARRLMRGEVYVPTSIWGGR